MNSGRARRLVFEAAQVVAIAAVLYVLVSLAVQSVHVVGVSMYPTLHDNDFLVASKFDYRLHQPERGDIVVLRDPLHPWRNLIKRIIGLPGDRIRIHERHVFINSRELNEPYLQQRWILTGEWPVSGGTSHVVTIPAGQYFVLGDNRDDSSDSREFGFVSGEEIAGKVLVRIWPLPRAELLTVRPSLAG